MDTLGNIIDSAQSGEKPDYDDLRYAVCTLAALIMFDRMALGDLSRAEKENKKKILSYSAVYRYEEHLNMIRRAFAKSPRDWLGENNDPDSASVQKRRKISLKIVENILCKENERQ